MAYATPHLPVMGLALLMSIFSAISKVAFLYVMMGILKPMFDGQGEAASDALGDVVLDLLAAVRPDAAVVLVRSKR